MNFHSVQRYEYLKIDIKMALIWSPFDWFDRIYERNLIGSVQKKWKCATAVAVQRDQIVIFIGNK